MGRIVSHAITGSDDHGVVQAVGDSGARSRPAFSVVHTAVDRIRTKTAQLPRVVREGVDFETASYAVREREALPAKAVIHGQLRVDLPAVAGIKAVGPHPLLDLLRELASLARIE